MSMEANPPERQFIWDPQSEDSKVRVEGTLMLYGDGMPQTAIDIDTNTALFSWVPGGVDEDGYGEGPLVMISGQTSDAIALLPSIIASILNSYPEDEISALQTLRQMVHYAGSRVWGEEKYSALLREIARQDLDNLLDDEDWKQA